LHTRENTLLPDQMNFQKESFICIKLWFTRQTIAIPTTRKRPRNRDLPDWKGTL